jgi:hypothetical protein
MVASGISEDDMRIHIINGRQIREGWMVVQMKPWHMVDIVDKYEDALVVARVAGPDYEVKWGSAP